MTFVAGTFVAGHFGEWLQGRLGPEGEVVLVTLACPDYGVHARRSPAKSLALDDPAGLVGNDRAARFLTDLGVGTGHTITLRADLPLGGGAGMSTAALVALARACAANPDRIAPACLALEGASDPLMLDAPDHVLWASRRAVTLRALPPPPRAQIIGGFWGPPQRTDPLDLRFPDIADLIEAWASAPDLPHAAQLASRSAERTTALRGPANDPTARLASRLGALGWARAHTGSARALIFAPNTAPPEAAQALAQEGFAHTVQFTTGG
jgi:hypothetical protein